MGDDEASIYLRLSKQAGDRNVSRQGMLDDCRELAARHGLTVVGEHVDNGKSGAIRDRPEFRAWLADATSGRAGVLLTWHADRLTREGVNAAARVLDVIEGKDERTGAVDPTRRVRFLDCHGLDSRDEDAFRWRFVIAAEVARGERDRIQRRNKAAAQRLAEQGRYTGGPPPFGTRAVDNPDGAGKVLALDEDEAAVMHDAAAWILRGDSVRSVAARLNNAGHRTRRGNLWRRSGLILTLTSEASKRFVFTPTESRALADALKPEPNPRKRETKARTSLLSRGMMVCAGCGSPMHAGRDRGNLRYLCGNASVAGSCPSNTSISGRVDAYVEGEFLSRFGRLAHYEPRVVIVGGEDLDDAEREHEAAEDALRADLSDENVARARAARERVTEARSQPQRRETTLVPTGRTIGETWQESDWDLRAALLWDALAGPIVVHPGSNRRGSLEPEWDKRLTVSWRGDVEGGESDYLTGQLD